jgi:NADH-quinone oxidoreductase subunit L
VFLSDQQYWHSFMPSSNTVKNGEVPSPDGENRNFLVNLSYNKFYVDEIYDAIIRKPLDALSDFLYNVIDKMGIDGLVNGIGDSPVEASKGLRLLQTGNVGFYIFMMVAGIIAVLVYSFVKI